MVLWRISRHQDLQGVGGFKANARWHYRGQPVVYLSESPASALLEVCVHTAANDLPPLFTLLRVEGPDTVVPSIEQNELPDGWRQQIEVTQELGTAWLRANTGVLLRVPSAIVPDTSNFLFNPAHPGAAAYCIVEALHYPFDPRLKQ